MDFFPQRPPVSPKIYAYELIGVASHRGYIKVGYTERDVDTRIREQTHTVAVPYRVLETWPAMRSDGSCFTDKDLHAVLRRKGFWQLNEGEDRNEWFRCTVNDVKAAVYAVRNRTENVENRTNDFSMRPEQKEAVDKPISAQPPPRATRSFCGTAKCGLARPLPPTSWQNEWALSGYWCSPLSPPWSVRGRRT